MQKVINRLPGENTTLECRRMSYEEIKPTKRKGQILEILQELKQATATEIAHELYKRGYAKTFDRNAAAPRLTELSIEGIVEPIGKKKCEYQGKMVSVYKIRED